MCIRDRSEADEKWEDGKYDLVILDVSLPDGSGFDICRNIRQTSKMPIMFLTAMDEETDIIMGLDIGGDDYITKPFKLAVFMSRINALLRRSDNFNQTDTELSSCLLYTSERLEQGVKEIFTSERYTEYLNTMSKFHNYSFNNTLLITMQKPEATLVAEESSPSSLTRS